MPYNLVKKVNAFVNEMKLIGCDKFEANDDKNVDENDSEHKVNEDQDQQERESGSDECNVGF